VSGKSRIAVAALWLLVASSVCAIVHDVTELLALHQAAKKGPARLAGLQRAAALSPLNYRYYLHQARIVGGAGQQAQARELYEAAIQLFPACGGCWLGVAEADAALGADPSDALTKAVEYGRSETTVRTRAAVLYARMGKSEEAAREFSAALGGRIRDRSEFYDLLNRLYPDDFVLDRIITDDDLISYFSFTQRSLPIDAVERVWRRVSQLPDAAEAQRPTYTRYLVQHGRVHAAWATAFHEDVPPFGTVLEPAVSGGDDGGPFGWRISSAEGVRAEATRCRDCTSAGYAIRLRFDGDHDPQYLGTSQITPVIPGAHYRLSARVKYDDLTSASGPLVLVQGVGDAGQPFGSSADCGLRAVSEQFRRTSDWHPVVVEFDVPRGCEGIRIFIARLRAKSLNKFVGGELWVDSVQLALAVRSTTEASEKTAPGLRPTAG